MEPTTRPAPSEEEEGEEREEEEEVNAAKRVDFIQTFQLVFGQ